MVTPLQLEQAILAPFLSMILEKAQKRSTSSVRDIHRRSIPYTSQIKCLRRAKKMKMPRVVAALPPRLITERKPNNSNRSTKSRRKPKSWLKKRSKRIWKNFKISSRESSRKVNHLIDKLRDLRDNKLLTTHLLWQSKRLISQGARPHRWSQIYLLWLRIKKNKSFS